VKQCIAGPDVCTVLKCRVVVVLLPRVPAGSEDAGYVMLSVNELTVCLDARTWHYFLNCSQAVCRRQLVSLGPVNNVLDPPVTGGWNPSAVKFQRHYRCVLFFSLCRFYLSIDSMSSQNWKGGGRKWLLPDLRLILHLPGGTEEDDDNFGPNIRSLGCLTLQPDTSHPPLRISNSPS
jgi:hypothetical protein